jgi:hypothetical protein
VAVAVAIKPTVHFCVTGVRVVARQTSPTLEGLRHLIKETTEATALPVVVEAVAVPERLGKTRLQTKTAVMVATV